MITAADQFADDVPRSNPWTQDDLGFAPFAERLAEALVRQLAPSGYVAGLHGEWGSGKSTVLNFIRAHLTKWQEEGRRDVEGLEWFDFEPWIVAGHQDLSAAFFKVLSEKLGGKAERWSLFRRRTKGAIDLGAVPLIEATSKLGFIIDHTGGVASKAGAAVTTAAVKKAADRWLSEPSLQKTYDQLVERLSSSGRRFLVFVDDIDRLTSLEIRSLMQMVKTVGRLPNVTYCLSYDRQIVWAALGELAPGDGARSGYAEKIVQHEVEVPVPSRSGLMRMLTRSLVGLPPPPDRGLRWMDMVQAGITRWIRHPRDVVRLSNAMNFAWAALKDEVDPYDALCMEALRLFDRKVFDWIRENRELLLGEGFRFPVPQERQKMEAENLGRQLSEGERADVVTVLRLLFPNRSNTFGTQPNLSTERWSDVVARRGIATSAGYTAYFSLAPSPAAVPKRMIDEAASSQTVLARQLELIDGAIALHDEIGASLVGEYLQELMHRVDRMPRATLPILLEALVNRTTEVSAKDEGIGFSGPASSHSAVVAQILTRLGPEESADALEGIFARSDDAGALSAVFVDLARSVGELPSRSMHRYVPRERLTELGAILGPKIEAARAADELDRLTHYYEVARAWAYLKGVDEPRAWLAEQAVRSAASLAKLARGLLATSNSGNGPSFSLYSGIETDLYDVTALREGCDAFVGATEVGELDRARIAALCEGLMSWKPGEPHGEGNSS